MYGATRRCSEGIATSFKQMITIEFDAEDTLMQVLFEEGVVPVGKVGRSALASLSG